MIRLAIIGCGEHARNSHAAPLARYARRHAGEISLVAACDLNLARAEEFRRDFGFERAYADVEQMLMAEQPDACVSVMPVELIGEVGAKLLERRIPCVIEKPLGSSLDEIEHLAHVARTTDTPHLVSVNRRFMPYLNRAASWAEDVGALQYVRATMVRHNRCEQDFIWSTAIHAIDALRFIAGEIEDFDTSVRRRHDLSSLWYTIALGFRGGAQGHLEILPTAGFVEESYELFGEGYRARVVAGSGTQRTLQCWRAGRLEIEEKATDDQPEDLRNGSYEEVVEFIGSLRAGTRPNPSIEDVLPSARFCFRLAESIGV